MLEKIQRQNRIVEDTVRGLQREAGYTVSSREGEESDDMGVSIGNEIHYHVDEGGRSRSRKTSRLWPFVVSALAATGVGGGIGYVLNDIFEQDAKPAVTVTEDLDTITDVKAGFGAPKRISDHP